MSIAGMQITLKSYFDFNMWLACIICILIFYVYFFIVKRQKSQGQGVSKKEIFCGLTLSIYLTLLISGTLLNRSVGDEVRVELLPFWSYKELWVSWEKAMFTQIVVNVLLFIPWGILFTTVSSAMRKFGRNVGAAMVFSFTLELMQLVFRCGLFELDDIFHNTLGAKIGYSIWRGLKKCECKMGNYQRKQQLEQ